jgi:hypothetical protein
MSTKLIRSIFWALVAVFVVVVIGILTTPAAFASIFRGNLFLWVFSISGAVFFLLGVALIFLTVREKVAGMPKKFLLLMGASAVGLPVSALLHNVIYALFILWFGADFWDRTGLGDEPVFFFMAIFICPLAFLVGIVGSVVLAVKNRQARRSFENI